MALICMVYISVIHTSLMHNLGVVFWSLRVFRGHSHPGDATEVDQASACVQVGILLPPLVTPCQPEPSLTPPDRSCNAQVSVGLAEGVAGNSPAAHLRSTRSGYFALFLSRTSFILSSQDTLRSKRTRCLMASETKMVSGEVWTMVLRSW